MAARSVWKGYLKVNLVSIPVKAYTATASSSKGITLNQLHAGCNSRIQYKKSCPIHGELTGDQIVSGYEYSKGQYVVINTDELEKLRTESDKAITIDTFIGKETLDPIYQTGKTHYLVPDGPVGQKPYTLLNESMIKEGRQAVARLVLHGKEQVVLLRPMGSLIAMATLAYDAEVTKPSAFEDEAPHASCSPEELKLMTMLIDASTSDHFDFSQYKDVYTDRLAKLIEAKVAGEEVVAPPAQEQVHVINLMDALKQSVALAKKQAPAEVAAPVVEEEPAAKRPPKKVTPGAPPTRAAKTPKKKIS